MYSAVRSLKDGLELLKLAVFLELEKNLAGKI